MHPTNLFNVSFNVMVKISLTFFLRLSLKNADELHPRGQLQQASLSGCLLTTACNKVNAGLYIYYIESYIQILIEYIYIIHEKKHIYIYIVC